MMGGLMGEEKKETSDGDNCWSGVLVEQRLESRGGRNFFTGSSAYRWSGKVTGISRESANGSGDGTDTKYQRQCR